MTKKWINRFGTIAAAFLFLSGVDFSQDAATLQYRRARLSSRIEKGIVIIHSALRNQDNLLEFFVADSDNHDFIYLTGEDNQEGALVLCPGSTDYPEILYIDADSREIVEKTGIQHVFPLKNLTSDLSNAYTDYSLLRYSQRRFKPLPTEISHILSTSSEKKLIYFNFPRFVNLAEPPPKRLELVRKLEYFSPKIEIRDISNHLDDIRMLHDEYAIRQIKAACRISGEAMMESMRSLVPGMTEDQLRSVYDFSCQFHGARSYAFPTSIRSGASSLDEHFPGGEKILKSGELVVIDAGVEINHYSADIQRTFPVSGKFSPEQAKLYSILKKAQEACIALVKPGVTMEDLQNKAIEILDTEGGYGKYFLWGTSHFLGMEVHDHGNNLIPFRPGVCITVEPGLMMPECTLVLEDDVLCTQGGHEWLTKFIPREIEDIESLMKETGTGEFYFKRK